MITPGVYKHFKGGKYTVIVNAVDSTNEWYPDDTPAQVGREANHEPVVVYIAHEHPERLCVRSEREWTQGVKWPDGVWRGRFVASGGLR